MVFNSLAFVVFITVVLAVYYRIQWRAQNWWLLIASYAFYGWWDYRFVGLLFFTSFFDYQCALWIEREQRPTRRRLLLSFSMIINMGVLCAFKYFNFFADSLRGALSTLGIDASFPTLHVILPLGISFYTFLSMSYTIDVYRREIPASRSLVDFLLFVSFFPHLVAGPIVRASYLLPQCQRPRIVSRTEVTNGVWLILLGLIKKTVIADRLGQVADWGFGGTAAPTNNWNSWLYVYAFAFQIYGDFSGYSDMARGLSKLMGFELIVNFKAPYLASNPPAFWQNWHISLSTWLRDYLYIPLGGNRKGRVRTYVNLMTTMLLGGLWHGAGLAYLLWGLYHGVLLAIHRIWHDFIGGKEAGSKLVTGPKDSSPGLGTVRVFVFFHLTCIGWLLFRAGALPSGVNQWAMAASYLKAMFQFSVPGSIDSTFWAIALLGCLAILAQIYHESMDRFAEWPSKWQILATASSLTILAIFGVFEGSQFIYFQF